jgi:hydroxymethylglutaryl-CoA synthase
MKVKGVYVKGYGVSIPRYRIKDETIAKVWGSSRGPIEEKAVAGKDEDSTTVAIEAARNALKRAEIDGEKVEWSSSGVNQRFMQSNPQRR